MSLFDLKPLTDVTLQELGLEPHELWLVKIGDHVFGPFETLSLRHYASDNKPDFDGAFATHMDVEEWKYFAHLEEFKDIFVVEKEQHVEKAPQYWVLNQGQLSAPHSKADIEKKLEMGILSLTDAVSKDEGETWNKIFQMEDFSHKLHSSGELPQCPKESQFQEAKIRVLEKIESKIQENAKGENMSGLAFLGQKTTQIVVLKIDEIDLETLHDYEISQTLRWAIPSAAVGMIALVLSGYMFFGEPQETYAINDSDVQVKRSISGSRSGLLEDSSKMRRPSSVRSFRSQRSGLTRNSYQESSYPTHIETHQEPEHMDPQHESAFDQEQPIAPQTEESLVQNMQPEQSLDAAMTGVQQPADAGFDQPQVEEVSDF